MARDMDGCSSVKAEVCFPGTTTWDLVMPWEEGWFPCNPSIAQGPDGYAAIVTCRDLDRFWEGGWRFAHDDGIIRTRNWFMDLDDDLQPGPFRLLPTYEGPMRNPMVRGIEDPRLYWSDGWRFSGTIYEHHLSGIHQIARLSVDEGFLSIVDTDPNISVKNLMPTGTVPEFIDIMASNPTLHGGACIPFEDGWLAVVHQIGYGMVYHQRFVILDHDLNIIRMTPDFWLVNDWIEFAGGLVMHHGDLVVSFGVHDHRAMLARIPLAPVLAAM